MSFTPEITTLLTEGAKLYAAEEFENAADRYAEACQVYVTQAEKDNAELLFLYGKALFQAAVAHSEVFGGAASDDDENDTTTDQHKAQQSGMFQFSEDVPLAEEEDDVVRVSSEDEEDPEENNELEEAPETAGEGEDKSDFEEAWEILDLARSLFEKEVEAAPASIDLQTKLSETYDLLGEVSLEAENFTQAAEDFKHSLDLRLTLCLPLSALVSESHYKYSLALEFCVDDPTARAKAVKQMELALASVRARGETDVALVQELEDRVAELRKDPVAEMEAEKLRIMEGLMGQAKGEEKAVTGVVNDLSAMVKKRKLEPKKDDPKRVKP